MKLWILSVCFLVELEGHSQLRSDEAFAYSFQQPILPMSKKTVIPNLVSDPAKSFRNASPLMTNLSSWNYRLQSNFFWTGTVTTMSYNKGKFGTMFYWDVQGNMRGAKGFIDISGNNKRGFKLVFPWQQFMRGNYKF
jgi:hypothetical protein